MKDLRRTATGDLDLSGGDIHWTESTKQHQKNILTARKGDYRLSPLVGVGLADYLLDEDKGGLRREIRIQFAKDGMKVKSLSVTPTKILIDAGY